MKHFSSVLSALLPTGSAPADKAPLHRVISQQEAASLMKSGSNPVIVDVRNPEEYAAGYIPGAINIPNPTIGRAEIPQLPDKQQLILVYCRSGARSKLAAKKLALLGYTNVLDFGGILDWTGEITRD